MATPQEGIFDKSSRVFYYLEYNFLSNGRQNDVKRALTNTLLRPIKGVHIQVSFGKEACKSLGLTFEPFSLENFQELQNEQGYKMPSTQNDIFFWVHGENDSDVFDVAMMIQSEMHQPANLVYEHRGFQYHESKDLMNFEDGTGNPKTDDKRYEAAIIKEGNPGEGGSIVFTQKWVHNLESFNHIPVPQQEKIIGRTKVENIELEGDDMPKDSHVSRTDIKRDGEAMKIWRRSAPFGGVEEHGLFFHCFTCDTKRVDEQLKSMLGMSDDGIVDRLLDFSKPTRGAYWFSPSIEDLTKLITTTD